ncbi:MAG: Peptidase family, partial [Pseudomonadota bacterium]
PTLAQLTSFVKIVSDSVNMKFNQEQELEADAEAFRILYRAGYSPDALMKVIKRIPEDSSAQLSHPSSDARIYELIQLGRGVKRPFNKKTLARFLLVAPSKSQKKLSPKPVQKKKSRKKL